MTAQVIDIRPQKGPQEVFLSTPADIAIYGGAAGGGKTYGLLLEPIRHLSNPGFGAVIFRRLSTQITGEGGLWDTTKQLYPLLDGEPGFAPRHLWKFPSGSKVSFSHLQYENDVLSWQGSQIPLICWDELTHFTEAQFFYMLSRNRSTCGVRPYVRATTNPDVDSWVAKFIAWWINQKTGFPMPERAGLLRYFSRVGDKMIWGDSKREVAALAGIKPRDADNFVKSVTFIPSKLEDNRILMEKDPSYKANLMALGRVERERLLDGNWKTRKVAGDVFPSNKVSIIPAIPANVLCWVRRWDLAASKPSEINPDPDATAGVLMGLCADGRIVVADVQHETIDSAAVRKLILLTAKLDKQRFGHVKIVVPQDPGQAGKDQAASLVKMLHGFEACATRETGSKEVRASLLGSQWQVGNVDIVEADWNPAYVGEMDGFPFQKHDDMVDASSGAFIELDSKAAMKRRHAALAG